LCVSFANDVCCTSDCKFATSSVMCNISSPENCFMDTKCSYPLCELHKRWSNSDSSCWYIIKSVKTVHVYTAAKSRANILSDRAAVGIEFHFPYPSHIHRKTCGNSYRVPTEFSQTPPIHWASKSSILVLHTSRFFIRCLLLFVM